MRIQNRLWLGALAFAFIFTSNALVAHAQYFPTFGTSYGSYVVGPGSSPQGVAVTTAPGSTQATQLVAAFNMGNIITLTSQDGVSWGTGGTIFASEHCDATAHANHCSPAIATYHGNPYVALWNTDNNLEVWRGQLVGGGNNAFTWSQVYNQNPGYGGMSSSPQMVVFADQLFIIYGVNSLQANNGQIIHNALQETVLDANGNWNTTNAGLGAQTFAAPTQVGLSEKNGTLYMVTQQNNSQRHLYYWSSPDGYNWSGAEYSSLYVDSGLSMVTYNNNLVFATKQNNSQDHLFLFSSPNGSTWYASQQSPLVHTETTPSMTLWNGGIELLYIDHSGNGLFYSTFAPF
ncbi:hypothetical protein [Terriglobus tenax]|uniref:hypothetical protein n=1 Tax=Terriglobus tenax TaxID=1111115 RepID=UPI0021DF78C4|nr:hypothetical protein [Terriglobus tenax]